MRASTSRIATSRVLLVTRAVGDDELAPRSREVAIGDVDRDALLAFRDQAVGEQRQIQRFGAALGREPLETAEGVGQQSLGVEEQAADQRALAVIDAAAGQKAKHAAILGRRPRRRTVPGAEFESHQK